MDFNLSHRFPVSRPQPLDSLETGTTLQTDATEVLVEGLLGKFQRTSAEKFCE
jgi:hypothetical protein